MARVFRDFGAEALMLHCEHSSERLSALTALEVAGPVCLAQHAVHQMAAVATAAATERIPWPASSASM